MHGSNAAALRMLLHGDYYRFHPSHAASSFLWGKHLPKGLIPEKKAFCSPVWSCGQLRVVCIAVASKGNADLDGCLLVWEKAIGLPGNVAQRRWTCSGI